MSLLSIRYLKARATMGTALMQHLLSAPFRPRRGASQWLRRLAKEDLAAAPPQVWQYLAGTSRCLACGLCDAAVSHDSPAATIQSAARQPADAPLALQHAAALQEAAAAIARICPARVPVQDVARLITENANMVAEARLAGLR